MLSYTDFVSPWDNADVDLILPHSSFPLAQCMGLEVEEPFGGVARFSIVDACFRSENTLEELHYLIETPLDGSRDVFVHKDFPNLDFNNIIYATTIYHSHVSPIYSLPSPSPEYYLAELIGNPIIYDTNIDLGYEDNTFSVFGGNVDDCVSLGYFRGYDPSIGPYCICL